MPIPSDTLPHNLPVAGALVTPYSSLTCEDCPGEKFNDFRGWEAERRLAVMGKGSGVVPAPTLLQAGPSAENIIQTGEGRGNTAR